MKHSITATIILICIRAIMFGQSAPDSLPANKGIIDYVNFALGRKVGDGDCMTLVVEAMGLGDSSSISGIELPVDEIDSASMQPGDIVGYTNMVTVNGDTLPNHIGIVYYVGTGFYLIANQNTYEDVAHSRVVIDHGYVLAEHSHLKSITTTIYRSRKVYWNLLTFEKKQTTHGTR